MKWNEYTADSFPEVYGAMYELDEFILHADFTNEDTRSILYMLCMAAAKESAIRSKVGTFSSVFNAYEDRLTLQEKMNLHMGNFTEEDIKEFCDKETISWRTNGEKLQVSQYYQEKTLPISELGSYIQ